MDSDCLSSHRCLSGRCFPKSGKVLLKSIVLGPVSCSDCSNTRLSVSLVGKRTLQQPGGVTCSSARVNANLDNGLPTSITFDTENRLNTCFKVSLVNSPY